MSKERVNNFTEKPISKFKKGDTLYASKQIKGYLITFYLEFISFDKGIVTGKVLEIQPNNIQGIWDGKILVNVGGEFKIKITRCHTYQNGCCWFEKDTKSKEYRCALK